MFCQSKNSWGKKNNPTCMTNSLKNSTVLCRHNPMLKLAQSFVEKKLHRVLFVSLVWSRQFPFVDWVWTRTHSVHRTGWNGWRPLSPWQKQPFTAWHSKDFQLYLVPQLITPPTLNLWENLCKLHQATKICDTQQFWGDKSINPEKSGQISSLLNGQYL